jgi:acyl-CoA thioester hydrolase
LKPLVSASVRTRPEFYDLDPMNIVWHGNYTRFFELARFALLDKIDYSYEQMRSSGYMWPIIDMRIRFYRPLRLRQWIDVNAALIEWETRLGIDYLVRDADDGRRLTKGRTLQVAVDAETEEMLWETPRILREKLAPFLESGS